MALLYTFHMKQDLVTPLRQFRSPFVSFSSSHPLYTILFYNPFPEPPFILSVVPAEIPGTTETGISNEKSREDGDIV